MWTLKVNILFWKVFLPMRLLILHVRAPCCSLPPGEAQFEAVRYKLRNSITEKVKTIPWQRHLNSWSHQGGGCGWGVLKCCLVSSYEESFPRTKTSFGSMWCHLQRPLLQCPVLSLAVFMGEFTWISKIKKKSDFHMRCVENKQVCSFYV